jgi:hypothetical protein
MSQNVRIFGSGFVLSLVFFLYFSKDSLSISDILLGAACLTVPMGFGLMIIAGVGNAIFNWLNKD